nr:histone deacetylase 14 [Tanacetum cinerariifolium]
MVEEVSFLKKDFKQKENKYIADFLDIKTLKEKVKDKLIKQDQSLQTVHMLCRPRPNSNALNRVAIGYKNPLCLTCTKHVQPALYNGHEIIKDNHTPAIVHNSEDTLEIAEITRKKINDKMNDPEYVTRKGIQKALTKEVKEIKDVFEELEAEVAQYAVDRKHDAIELKNLLVANDNLIAECLSQEVFSELANLRETNNHDNQKELINHFSKLEAQNDLFRAENDKIKQHYKELYDSIKITRTKHIEQVTKLTAKNVMLKTSVSKAKVQPPVLTRTMHAVDVEPIVPHLRNNRDAHLDYLRHLKESVETIRDIVKEAKVTNVHVPPSMGVNSFPNASGSQPKRHLKAHRISPAKDKMADVNAPSGQTQTPTMAPSRALLTIINLCLKRKTFGFERPRAPVLQILWGIITRNNIDYAERIWEEFTESIHTFIQDKRNLSQHTSGKKRATLIVIPSIRFTKLLIHHLQRKHRFHPRPNSPLHLSNEEPVLGYLKFSAKGTKSEVFRMPIPDSLITVEIQQATYYREYLANVTHHRKYLAGETGGVQNPPASKPTQPARKPKAPTRPSISILVASTQPAPTSAPTKSQENKRKQATETTDKPAKAKRIKRSISCKTRQPRGSPKSVGASEAEEVPAEEPQVADEDADYQKAVEESMKDAYALPKGKGKAKVTEDQVAHDLLSLQKHKKTSPADQYIFQRQVSEPTGSSEHDESTYALLGQSNNEEESEKVVLEAEEGDQDEGQAGPDPDAQAKDQTRSDAGAQAEGQARSNPDETSEGQAGSNPDETSEGQAGSNPDETSKGQVEPDPERIMADLIQVNKDMEERLDSHGSRLYTLEQLDIPQRVSIDVSEVVMEAVDWAMQAPLRDRFRDLPEADMKEILHQRMWESDSYKSHEDHMQLFEALEKSMNRDHSEELAQDLAKACKKKKKSRESPKTPPGSPSHQPPPPPPPAGPSGASGAPRASGSAQMPTSPPPPSSTNQESPSKGSAAPSSSKTAASAEYQAWTTTDIRLRPSISLTSADLEMDEDMAPDEQAQSSNDEDIGSAHIPTVNLRQGWWKPFEEERPTTPKPAWSIRSSDVPVLTNNWALALASNYSPPPEDSLLAQTGPAYEIVKVFHPDVIHLQYQMEECHKLLTDSVDDPILRHNVSKPLPLRGPPGQVTIQSDFFFNKDLEYLRYGSKDRRPALSISKMKAAYYPDAGLEQMVPD